MNFNKIVIIVLVYQTSSVWSYLLCNEMKVISEVYFGPLCTFTNITDRHFFNDQFYQTFTRDAINILQIKSTKIADIPTNMFQRFPRIKTLDLSYCGLEDIRKSSFNVASSMLLQLNMTHCDFRKLFHQMFGSTRGLMVLNISHGQIEDITDTAFEGLGNLMQLDLSDNKVKTVSEKIFADLVNLRYLDLSLNQISILERNLFEKNIELQWLSLDHNQIAKFDVDWKPTKGSMKFLSIADNKISEFKPNFEIEQLNIAENQISQIEIGPMVKSLNASFNNIQNLVCKSPLEHIQSLILTNNSISSLECISDAKKLVILDLSHNNIGKLNHSSFAFLTELKELKLGHANISNLVLGVFSHQDKLEVLDISYNDVKNFPFTILIAAKNLKKLCIDGNAIDTIPYEKIDQMFPSLETLGIGDNMFSCQYLTEIFTFFNQRKLNIVASAGSKIFHTSNIKGISCDENEVLANLEIPIAVEGKQDLKPLIKSVQTLQNAVNSIQVNMSNLSAKFTELNTKLDENIDKMEDMEHFEHDETDQSSIPMKKIHKMQNEIEYLRAHMKEQTTAESLKTQDGHGDISLIRNLLLVLITGVIIFVGYKVYGKLKKSAPLRRFSSHTTLNTNIEMNNK